MSTAALQAAIVRLPRKGYTFIVAPGTSSAVITIPPELLGHYGTVMADGADVVIAAAATPTSLAADEGLTASVITALDTDGIKTSVASSASPVTYSGADINGTLASGGTATFTAGAIVSATASNHAHITGGDIYIVGTQWGSGAAVRAKVTVPNGGNGTFYGTTLYRPKPNDSQLVGGRPHMVTVTSVEIPAQGGTSGTWEIGIHTRTAAAADGALPCPDGVLVPYYFDPELPFLAYAAGSTVKLVLARTS